LDEEITMASLFERIAAAHEGIRRRVQVTPLEPSIALSAELGCHVLLKAEHLHPVGSFKIRGATNKIRVLNDAERKAGVIAASTGNHGQGVARAGALAGVGVTVFVGAAAAPQKLAAIRAWGAELVVVDGPPINAELEARRQSEIQGKTYISPYNDLDVVAGQGTIGFELFEQEPDLDAVFVSVGGGGLISGVGMALKQLNPRTRIVAVWPENSPCMLNAIRAGRIVETEEFETLSDATEGAIEPGSVTFPICREVIDEMLTVTEAEIAAAMWRVAQSDHWIVEGSAGVALAGLIKTADANRGRKVAVVLCGRNIAMEKFYAATAAAATLRR
jgi:threonine dehydratase